MNTNSTTSAVLLADVLIEITGRVNDLKDDVRSAEAAHDNKVRELAVAMESVKNLRETHNRISTQFEILKGLNEQQQEVSKDLREQLGHRENERDEAVQRLNDCEKKLFESEEYTMKLARQINSLLDQNKRQRETIKKRNASIVALQVLNSKRKKA